MVTIKSTSSQATIIVPLNGAHKIEACITIDAPIPPAELRQQLTDILMMAITRIEAIEDGLPEKSPVEPEWEPLESTPAKAPAEQDEGDEADEGESVDEGTSEITTPTPLRRTHNRPPKGNRPRH